MTQHYLPQTMPPAASAYIASMPPGRVELFSLTPLDKTGVACWNVIFLPADGRPFQGETPHGVGYGVTDTDAIIGATGELAEAVHSAAGFAAMPRVSGSFAALSTTHGKRGVADPLTLCLPAGSPVDGDTAMQWVSARRWPSGETVLVPAEMAACAPGDLPAGYTPFTTPITNGLGAGPTLDFAIGHGLGELLQRDGNGLGFRAMDRGIVIDFDVEPADPRTRDLLALFSRQGIDVLPKFAADEFGVANIYVVGCEPVAVPPFPMMVTACGEAASLDREQALRKALLEFASSRMRKSFSHAPLDAVSHVAPPGYVERFTAFHNLATEESRALSAMKAWCGSDAASLRATLSESVLSRRGRRSFSSLPTWPGQLSDTPVVTEIARRLAEAGMEVLFLDFSPPQSPDVHVVKVIVPGLEVETMSYHRIGERGVLKLLERNSPLVGLGRPPEGARAIRLPAGAAERLGGAAWLDVVAVDRLVGSLYPLYREPLVHSAPIALARAR